MAGDYRFYVENYSKTGFEPWLERHVFVPIVKHIPAAVHPNAITLVNHGCAWVVFAAAGAAPFLRPGPALLMRVTAAVALFACIVLDSLDGIHARRTGQTSRLGEVLDHWFDAINVPLYAGAMILTLGLDPLLAAAAMVLGVVNYDAQLTLYNRTGRFVHPGTSGVDAQVGMVGMYIVFGLLFYYVPRETAWLAWGINLFALFSIAISIWDLSFYLRQLRGHLLPPFVFIGCGAGFALLYWLGMLGTVEFMLAICFVSFRLSGTFVLRSVFQERYSGVDLAIPLGIVAILAVNVYLPTITLQGYALRTLAPYVVFAYLGTVNVSDLLRRIGALRAASVRNA